MASARYWRIYITANNGDSYTAISELEFRAESGGADLTSPSMACSQSSYYSDWTAARAVNNSIGSAGNCWVTAGDAPPHWAWFDFGSPVAPVELVIWGESGLPGRSPKDFQIQYSDDATTWTTLATFTNVTGWSDSARTFTLVAYQVSGVVREAGTPVGGRTLRAYRRDTGALLGQTVTGDGVTPSSYEYTGVAGEGGSFTVTAGQTVRYGADTRWFEKTFTSAGTYSCNSTEFGGDPAYGTGKTCQLVTPGSIPALGSYSLQLPYGGEVQIVCLDDSAGTTYNDLIIRTTPA